MNGESLSNVVVAGSYNACPTLFVNELPCIGETVLAGTLIWEDGGKGFNQAVGLARLGLDCMFICAVGRDHAGSLLREKLRAEGMRSDGVIDRDGSTGLAVVIVRSDGENMIVVAPGVNEELSACMVWEAFREELSGARAVLLQLECSVALVEELAPRLEAAGVAVVLNPAPVRSLSREVLKHIEVLTPNEGELKELGRVMGIGDGGSIAEIASAFVESGVRNVVVTRGDKGALLATRDGVKEFGAYTVDVVDTTGAGDAFNAGLTFALVNNWDIEEAVVMGCRAGAYCVRHAGVIKGLGSLAEIMSINGGLS